jgi:HAD superfamily hydrolase (TIGR01509 family)
MKTIELPWNTIDTVLLDMDGTLLDLHFDNYFWLDYIPQCYSEHTAFSLDEAKKLLAEYCEQVKGTLDWYCLDYWSNKLNLDIVALKKQVDHKIAFRPNTIEFLKLLNEKNKRVILATNAHPKALELKLLKADFSDYFEVMSSSHDIGFAKESNQYWEKFTLQYHVNPKASLFIDDSLSVLKSAEKFGIAHNLGIAKPDLQKNEINCAPFTSIQNFSQLMF